VAPELTLTIVLYNSASLLPECLQSIRSDVESGFADLIAVDNASPDESVAILSEALPDAAIVRSETNRGFAGGANLAWPKVGSRYWMLLNPDIVVPPGGLRTLVDWMDAHPRIAFASPDLVGSEGQPGTPGRALPSISLTLLEVSRLHRLIPRRARGKLLRGAYWTGGDQLDAGWVPGAALIARREAIDEIGLMSESFFMYGEDVDWCWRARSAGWDVGVCGDVTFLHGSGSSVRRTWDADERAGRMAVSMLEAVKRMRGTRYARAYGRATALALRLEALNPRRSSAQRERSASVSHAYRDGVKSVRTTPNERFPGD
jgi:GT2 family glycosyltransferase